MQTLEKQFDASQLKLSKCTTIPTQPFDPFQDFHSDSSPIFLPVTSTTRTPRPKLNIATNHESYFHADSKSSLSSAKLIPLNRERVSEILSPQSPVSRPSLHDDFLSPRTRKIGSSNILLIKTPTMKTSINLCATNRVPKSALLESAKRLSTDYCEIETLGTSGTSKIPMDFSDLPSEEQEDFILMKPNPARTRCSMIELAKEKRFSELHLNTSETQTINEILPKNLVEYRSETTIKSPQVKPFKRRIRFKQLEKKVDSAPTTGTAKNKTSSKMLSKFSDAMEKAKNLNGVAMQLQFDKQNEEEESDFYDLFEMLNK